MKFLNYFYNLFNEARRGFFPKQSVLEVLEKYKDDENVFVSFRDVIVWQSSRDQSYRKEVPISIGLNPKNRFSTPTGIYGYVLKPMWENNFLKKYFPYANDRPTIVVYQPNFEALKEGEKIIKSSSFDEKDLDEVKNRIKNLLNYTDYDILTLLKSIEPAYKKTPFQTFWSLTRQISIEKTYNLLYTPLAGGDKNVNYWTNLLIKLGYPIVIDDVGSGTIHSNEPTQSFTASKKYTKVLEIIENKNWKSVGENSSTIIINRIIDDIKNKQGLQKWKNIIEKLHQDVYKKLVQTIIQSNALNFLTQQDCEILQIQNYLLKDNSYLRNLSLQENDQITEYLKSYIQDSDVADFLYFYIVSSSLNVLNTENKNFYLKIISKVFKDENIYKNYPLVYFRTLALIAQLFYSEDSKAVNFFCIKTLKAFISKKQVEDGIARSLCNLLLTNAVNKDSKIWNYIEKELKDIIKLNALYHVFFNKIQDSDVNMSNKASEWFLNNMMNYFNEFNTTISQQYFYFIKNNTSLIQKLDIRPTCKFLLMSSVANYDQNILENCLNRLNDFDRKQVIIVMREEMVDVKRMISKEIIVENFLKIPNSLKNFLLKYEDFVDLLTRSYIKIPNANIQNLTDLIGSDNLQEWYDQNKSDVLQLTYSPEIINNFPSTAIFYNSEKTASKFLYFAGETNNFKNFFDYIIYFSKFNSENRKNLIDLTEYSYIQNGFDFNNSEYEKIFQYCDQLLDQNENISKDSLVENVKQYILQSDFFLKTIIEDIRNISQSKDYLRPVLNNLLPIKYLGKPKTINSFVSLFSEYELYDKMMDKLLPSKIQNYMVLFLKKSDVMQLLSAANKTLPPDYLTQEILDESSAKNNLIYLKAYIDGLPNNPDMVPLLQNNVSLLSFIQMPNSNPLELYTFDQYKNAQELNPKNLQSILYLEYPLFVKKEYYEKLFGQLPQEYVIIKNNPQEKISDKSKNEVLDFIKNVDGSTKRIFIWAGEKYIIFPITKMTEFGLFFPELGKKVDNNLVEVNENNSQTTSKVFYIKLSKLQSLMNVPEELLQTKINKEIIEKMIQAFENPIPYEIIKGRPKNTMQYGGTKLVLLGTGLYPEKWTDVLDLDSSRDLWHFEDGSWYSYATGYSTDVYYALEKSVWEAITGKIVPDEYYKNYGEEKISDESVVNFYKKMLYSNMYDAPSEIQLSSNKVVPNFLILPDGQKLVLLGKGITQGWKNILSSNNIVLWNGGNTINVWTGPNKDGNITYKYYAIYKQDWEKFTNNILPDSYYEEFNNSYYSDKSQQSQQSQQSQSDDKEEDDGLI